MKNWLLMLAVLLGLLSGCGQHRPRAAILCITGLDNSKSVSPNVLGQYFALTARQGGRLDAGDLIAIWVVNSRATEIFNNPPPPGGSEGLLRTLQAETHFRASEGRGTYPERFWTEAAREAEAAGGRRVIITFYSDGENSDPTAQSKIRIRACARRLRDNPHVARVSIVGIQKEMRPFYHDTFDSMGARFRMYGVSEIGQDTLSIVEASGEQGGSQ